jgi:hypothetical protein
VHHVKINVTNVQLGKRVLKGLGNNLRTSRDRSQLCGDKDVFSLQASLLKSITNTSTDFDFITILRDFLLLVYKGLFIFFYRFTYSHSSINVTITVSKGSLDGVIDNIARLGRLPSTQTDSRDGVSVVPITTS